jgi:hypothetical protein
MHSIIASRLENIFQSYVLNGPQNIGNPGNNLICCFEPCTFVPIFDKFKSEKSDAPRSSEYVESGTHNISLDSMNYEMIVAI